MAKTRQDERYSEQETAHRRDAVIKRMLATPPKPHSEMKVGKSKAQPKPKAGKNPAKRKTK
jgi:hypothetical protein